MPESQEVAGIKGKDAPDPINTRHCGESGIVNLRAGDAVLADKALPFSKYRR
jgi:hypothetical protein